MFVIEEELLNHINPNLVVILRKFHHSLDNDSPFVSTVVLLVQTYTKSLLRGSSEEATEQYRTIDHISILNRGYILKLSCVYHYHEIGAYVNICTR